MMLPACCEAGSHLSAGCWFEDAQGGAAGLTVLSLPQEDEDTLCGGGSGGRGPAGAGAVPGAVLRAALRGHSHLQEGGRGHGCRALLHHWKVPLTVP